MRNSANIKNRLYRLELTLAIGRPIGLWPPILSFAEWDRTAQESQEKLLVDANDRNEAAVSRRYRT